MRRFLVVGHRAVTTPDFPIDDLTGAGGRMDLMLNAATAALLVSHDIRSDAEVTMLLLGPPDPPRAVRLVGSEIESLHPDVRSNAAVVRRALARSTRLEWKASPGVYASKRGLSEILDANSGGLVVLAEGGKDIRAVEFPSDVMFVLSDTVDLTPDEDAAVMVRGAMRASTGPRSIHTDHAIAIVHNELDRREAVL